MSVRPLLQADLPQVVDLYWRYMRRAQGSAPAALRANFQKLYFTNPWSGNQQHSVVYESTDGKIVGFLGIIPRRMSICGEPIRVAFGGNFVVHPESRSQLAASRLLGAYMAGNYDLWETDSANDLSRHLLERLGFRTIPALSIHWARPLRPIHYAVHTVSKSISPAASATIRLLSKPFCALGDAVAGKLSANPFRQIKPRFSGSEADLATLLQCFSEFRQGYSLWPEYDATSLAWLLSFMEASPSRGNLRKIVVRDEDQQIVGWYIYYVKRGSVGEVVQVAGRKKLTRHILDHLFFDAWQQGLIALHGVVPNRLMADFSDKGCLFTCRGGWTVARARNPEIMDLLERGDAFLSRLDGEWCLNPGD
jgi:ribosomal protein S18 acetylase RimI-like enzyme